MEQESVGEDMADLGLPIVAEIVCDRVAGSDRECGVSGKLQRFQSESPLVLVGLVEEMEVASQPGLPLDRSVVPSALLYERVDRDDGKRDEPFSGTLRQLVNSKGHNRMSRRIRTETDLFDGASASRLPAGSEFVLACSARTDFARTNASNVPCWLLQDSSQAPPPSSSSPESGGLSGSGEGRPSPILLVHAPLDFAGRFKVRARWTTYTLQDLAASAHSLLPQSFTAYHQVPMAKAGKENYKRFTAMSLSAYVTIHRMYMAVTGDLLFKLPTDLQVSFKIYPTPDAKHLANACKVLANRIDTSRIQEMRLDGDQCPISWVPADASAGSRDETKKKLFRHRDGIRRRRRSTMNSEKELEVENASNQKPAIAEMADDGGQSIYDTPLSPRPGRKKMELAIAEEMYDVPPPRSTLGVAPVSRPASHHQATDLHEQSARHNTRESTEIVLLPDSVSEPTFKANHRPVEVGEEEGQEEREGGGEDDDGLPTSPERRKVVISPEDLESDPELSMPLPPTQILNSNTESRQPNDEAVVVQRTPRSAQKAPPMPPKPKNLASVIAAGITAKGRLPIPRPRQRDRASVALSPGEGGHRVRQAPVPTPRSRSPSPRPARSKSPVDQPCHKSPSPDCSERRKGQRMAPLKLPKPKDSKASDAAVESNDWYSLAGAEVGVDKAGNLVRTEKSGHDARPVSPTPSSPIKVNTTTAMKVPAPRQNFDPCPSPPFTIPSSSTEMNKAPAGKLELPGPCRNPDSGYEMVEDFHPKPNSTDGVYSYADPCQEIKLSTLSYGKGSGLARGVVPTSPPATRGELPLPGVNSSPKDRKRFALPQPSLSPVHGRPNGDSIPLQECEYDFAQAPAPMASIPPPQAPTPSIPPHIAPFCNRSAKPGGEFRPVPYPHEVKRPAKQEPHYHILEEDEVKMRPRSDGRLPLSPPLPRPRPPPAPSRASRLPASPGADQTRCRWPFPATPRPQGGGPPLPPSRPHVPNAHERNKTQ